MTSSNLTATVGTLEFCLFPAEGDTPAYACVNRYLSPETYTYLMRIPASIYINGTTYSVKEISQSAFCRANIDKVYVPKSITAIRSKAFEWAKVKRLEGCESVKLIENYAFAYCERLSCTLKFPAVERIMNLAFHNCAIEAAVLPKCLKSISANAFAECRKLKKVTMCGCTKIATDLMVETFEPFLRSHTSVRLNKPFTQLKKVGHCLVSADGSTLYHFSSNESTRLSIPGSIAKIVGKPFDRANFKSIIFCKPTSNEPINVILNSNDCQEIICKRPINLFSLTTHSNTLDIHCEKCRMGLIQCNSKNTTVHIHRGARIICVTKKDDQTINYVYHAGVREIDELPGEPTIIGPDVQKVHIIKESDLCFQVTMQCATPPEVDIYSNETLANMELRVPEGFTDAYKRHRVWGMAGRITDGKTVAVDRISKTVMKSRKKAMTYEMAESVALKFAAMKLDDTATVFRRDNIIEVNLDLNIATNEMEGIKYTKYLPIDEATNSDAWDALANEVYNIKMFLCTGTIL